MQVQPGTYGDTAKVLHGPTEWQKAVRINADKAVTQYTNYSDQRRMARAIAEAARRITPENYASGQQARDMVLNLNKPGVFAAMQNPDRIQTAPPRPAANYSWSGPGYSNAPVNVNQTGWAALNRPSNPNAPVNPNYQHTANQNVNVNQSDYYSFVRNNGGWPVQIDGSMGDADTGVTSDTGSSFADIVTSISQAVAQGINIYDQIQLQNFNMDLIKAGKPPLSSAQVASIAPQFAVGLAPQTQNMLLWLAAGAGGLILLSTLLKHRRR